MRSLSDILDRVQKLTEQGKLTWNKDAFSSQQFYVDIGDKRITVWAWVDDSDGSNGVSIRLSEGSSYGEVLDHTQADEYSSKYVKYDELFNTARRSALNVDKKITEIEDMLKRLGQKD